jgi:hypothetical protein
VIGMMRGGDWRPGWTAPDCGRRSASGLWGGGAGRQGQRPGAEGRAGGRPVAGDGRWILARALRVVEDDREKGIFFCDAFL